MKKRTRDWAKRNPLAAAVVLNLVAIGITAVFTSIALGPDSLLDENCSGKGCFESHGAAAFWAIFSGATAVWILVLTLRAAKRGRLKKPEAAAEPERAAGDSAPPGSRD